MGKRSVDNQQFGGSGLASSNGLEGSHPLLDAEPELLGSGPLCRLYLVGPNAGLDVGGGSRGEKPPLHLCDLECGLVGATHGTRCIRGCQGKPREVRRLLDPESGVHSANTINKENVVQVVDLWQQGTPAFYRKLD